MRRRLVLSAVFVTLTAVLVLGIPLGFAGRTLVTRDFAQRLEHNADTIAGSIEDDFEKGRSLTTAAVARATPADLHVIVLGRDGTHITYGPQIEGPTIQARSHTAQKTVVIAQASSALVNARVRKVWLVVGALSIAGIAAGVLLALIQARRLSRPLDSIARVSAELGAGDFSVRAQTFGIPEIDAVVTALNQSAEQIAELVGAERRFASAVSHQLRTPLTALRLRLEELTASAGNEPAAAEARAALAQTDRLTATIDELLSLTRRGRTGNKVKLDLSTLVQVHVDSWRSQLDLAGRKLVATNGPNTPVTATPGALGQALDVLLDNALKHGAGAVTTEVAREDGRAIVRVSDQGRGIDPALAERIFEWNTSSAGTLGIGLSLARALVESQGGRLDLVQMHPATFEISIPTAE